MDKVMIMASFFLSFAASMGVAAWAAINDHVGTAALIIICATLFFGNTHIKID